MEFVEAAIVTVMALGQNTLVSKQVMEEAGYKSA